MGTFFAAANSWWPIVLGLGFWIGLMVYWVVKAIRDGRQARNDLYVTSYERQRSSDETRKLEAKINWHEMQADRGYNDEPGVNHIKESERLTRELKKLRRQLVKKGSGS